jgi:cell division protein ZapA (FtsZ GTPase activity inhibitor)
LVSPGGIDPVLITNNFPELGTDLVATLAALNVQDLTHLGGLKKLAEKISQTLKKH